MVQLVVKRRDADLVKILARLLIFVLRFIFGLEREERTRVVGIAREQLRASRNDNLGLYEARRNLGC